MTDGFNHNIHIVTKPLGDEFLLNLSQMPVLKHSFKHRAMALWSVMALASGTSVWAQEPVTLSPSAPSAKQNIEVKEIHNGRALVIARNLAPSGMEQGLNTQLPPATDAASTSPVKWNTPFIDPKQDAQSKAHSLTEAQAQLDNHSAPIKVQTGPDLAILNIDPEALERLTSQEIGLPLSSVSFSVADNGLDASVKIALAADKTTQDAGDMVISAMNSDPELKARIGLARQLMLVDGSEDLTRHIINTAQMKAIITEVNKYIVISKLSEKEQYRLSAIANTASLELSERILNLYAYTHAKNMSQAELREAISALDTPEQKKLTKLLMSDDGEVDKKASLELEMAKLKIIAAYENSK